MRYYLMSNGMDTGESFKTLEELHWWYNETTGEWPDKNVKAAMRNGYHFTVGARSFNVEKRKTNSLAVA